MQFLERITNNKIVKFFDSRSIRTKFFVSLGLLIFILIFGLTYYFYLELSNVLKAAGLEAEAAPILKKFGLVSLGAYLFGLFVVVVSGLFVSNPIIRITGMADKIGEGDLTVDGELPELKRGDEIGVLARAIRKMGDNHKDIIQRVRELAENVASSSEELYASGEQVGQVAEQVGRSIQNIAAGAQEQSAQVQENVAVITDMVDRIAAVGKNSVEMDKAARCLC